MQDALITPQDFIRKWQRASLSERSAAQQHFIYLCHLVGEPTPAEVDPVGAWYTFEKGARKTGGGKRVVLGVLGLQSEAPACVMARLRGDVSARLQPGKNTQKAVKCLPPERNRGAKGT